MSAMEHEQQEKTVEASALTASIRRARFEIIPMKGVEEQIEYLPTDAVVTVTASPTKGMDATLDLAARVAQRGPTVVPHLSARLIGGRSHLEELLARLRELGIVEAFVIAGDATEAAGPYEGAVELLEEMATLDHDLADVGITGYPERHAFIPDRTTIEAMERKAPHATYIVSQICYDATVIRGWISALRLRGVTLPVFVGIPGVIDRSRLLRVSLRVGLGDSVRYLKKQHEVATKMMAGYTPDELVAGLADLVGDPYAGVLGWHVFTFNEVERTDRWRQELLAATPGGAL
ncbi:MAG: methylenetetrahydrofolate reductase [Nitriliruptoraceae bacterium]